jgi:ketosteroid isomerase-like protein
MLVGGLFLAKIFLVTLALFTAAAAHAAWDHHRDAKLEIMDMEQQWRSATLNSDIPAMDKLLSDDYVGISWTGQVNNKMSQLDRLRLHHIAVTKMDVSDLKVKIVGTVAIVTSSAQVEGTADGAPINGTFRYTRVYQQSPNGIWKITNFEATRVPTGPRGHGHHPPPSSNMAPASPAPPVVPPPSVTSTL